MKTTEHRWKNYRNKGLWYASAIEYQHYENLNSLFSTTRVKKEKERNERSHKWKGAMCYWTENLNAKITDAILQTQCNIHQKLSDFCFTKIDLFTPEFMWDLRDFEDLKQS